MTTAPSSWACFRVLYPWYSPKCGPLRRTANFSSRFLFIGSRTDNGGSRMSETKDVTSAVKAAARL